MTADKSAYDSPEGAIEIRLLEEHDVQPVSAAFDTAGWKNKQPALFGGYLSEQDDGRRIVLLALLGGEVAGYLTVDWMPTYPPFRRDGIPEIQDFNVLPPLRRRGIGSRLMDEAERRIAERSSVAGIGFGMFNSYGAAQRMYVKRGYVPDGRGLWYRDRYVGPGDRVTADDDLVLFLTKRLT